MSEKPRQRYTSRIEHYKSQIQSIKSQINWSARGRGALFLLGLFLCLHVWQQGSLISFPGLLLLFDVIGFVVLAGWHENLARRQAAAEMSIRIHSRQLARMDRDWNHMEKVESDVDEEFRILAKDLDVIGHASLVQLVDSTATRWGHQVLTEWLTRPAYQAEVRRRQAAVQSLSEMNDQLDDWYLVSRFVGEASAGPESLSEWVEGPGWLSQRPVLGAICVISPLVGIIATVGGLMGWLPGLPAGIVVIVIALLQLAISVVLTGNVHDEFYRIARNLNEVERFVQLIDLAMQFPTKSDMIKELQEELLVGNRRASVEIKSLGRIMVYAYARQNPVLGFIYLPLQLSTLWDFQMIRWLEVWQRRNREHVRGWFEAVAQLEAISSLATLHYDQPDWQFPDVVDDAQEVVAEGLGHPLLPPDSCVANDVTVGPSGTCLLVTGSNMSGKSTLLRSLGLNILLAQAGAPVCARSLRLPPCYVSTSMRIHDSLEDGVSFYMAELLRLKQIVDHARELESQPLQFFFLLDEILQGTNSAERHIAVANVVAHLVEHGAIGAISTHDLALANHEKLASACQPVYFREQLVADERKMVFDYQLRHGVAPTTNALVLLEMVGLLTEDSNESNKR